MSTEDRVTFYNSLEDIYVASSVLKQGERWNALANAFTKEYGHAPSYIVRAPGRINLIGEHIDYCLFGVMPAAVELDTIIACSVSTQTSSSECRITVSNLDPRWPKASIDVTKAGTGWEVGDMPGWTGYIRAAMIEVLDKFFAAGSKRAPASLVLMVTGNIPPGSGLSSSAALIVSSLLAILVGNDFISATPSSDSVTNAELVQLARDSERILGVNSGGMDQSASVLSRPGSGLYVSFWPNLTVEAVKLPSTTVNGKEEPLAMVISNSLTTHNLASDAKRHYNLRVVETRIAARLLYHALGLQPENPATALTLREVVSRYAGEKEGERMPAQQLEKAIEDMLGEVEKVLGKDERFKKEGFTVDEMVERSGMDAVTFKRTQIDFIPVEADTFHLYNRAKHVFSEALRVLQFRRHCLSTGSRSSDDSSVAESLGRLMDESHASCRDLYDCSSTEMDELVSVCKKAGALGSRLSGAGWGGCVVSLIPRSREKEFIAYITSAETGYSKYRTLKDDQLKTAVFESVPGTGAGVLQL